MKISVKSQRKNKFNNIKSLCRAGHLHDSKMESSYCNKLQLLVKAGEIKWFEVYPRKQLKVNGKLICEHIIDFVVFPKDGYLEYHEVKGFETPVWKLKKKLFKALFPECKYIVIKKGRIK